jgi:hypothetical protein
MEDYGRDGTVGVGIGGRVGNVGSGDCGWDETVKVRIAEGLKLLEWGWWQAELDRFCNAMISIREEIREIELGAVDRCGIPSLQSRKGILACLMLVVELVS